MKRFSALAALLALAAGVAPVFAQNASFDQQGSLLKSSKALPSVPAPKASLSNSSKSNADLLSNEKHPWTVMVFVNGKNNLEDAGIFNLHQMEQIGSSKAVKIIAEIGRMDWVDGDPTWTQGTRQGYKDKDRTLASDTSGQAPAAPTASKTWAGSKRIIVLKNTGDQSKVASMVLQTSKKMDMGNWQHLVNFVTWAKTNFPADHYMLVIWNHGSGWQSVGKILTDVVNGQQTSKPNVGTKGISYDDKTGNSMTTVEMGVMMSKLGKIDVYGSDACLMADSAVDAEIYKSAEYIVGSEETEPGDGWEYTSFLSKLNANPNIAPVEVAKAVVQGYQSYYDQHQDEGSVTQSAVQASAVPGLARVLDAFAKAAMASADMPAIKAAAGSAEGFDNPGDKDLYDFMSKVVASAKDAGVKAKANAVMSYVTGTLVLANASTGDHKGKARGISIYAPVDSYDSSFNTVQLAKGTAWGQFCQALIK